MIVFALASSTLAEPSVIGVEFPDVKDNPKIAAKDWELSLFSKASYTRTSPTSQPAQPIQGAVSRAAR